MTVNGIFQIPNFLITYTIKPAKAILKKETKAGTIVCTINTWKGVESKVKSLNQEKVVFLS